MIGGKGRKVRGQADFLGAQKSLGVLVCVWNLARDEKLARKMICSGPRAATYVGDSQHVVSLYSVLRKSIIFLDTHGDGSEFFSREMRGVIL